MTASTSDFAHTIRTFRLRAGLSQEELAERAGVSARAVSDMERGLRKSPRPETLRLLAEALGLDETARAELFAAARPELGPNVASPSPEPPARTTSLPLHVHPPPIPLTRLIGREREVALVTELLTGNDARLISLVGPGGVGKTRLSLGIANQVGDAFSDGVAYIDCSTLSHHDQVIPAIATGLGVELGASVDTANPLHSALRQRSLLLMIDNFEHLLDAGPRLSALLAVSPLTRMLVTSRVRLQLRGEQVVHLAPLEVPSLDDAHPTVAELAANPAVMLLLDRARQADAGFALDERNVHVLAEICRRLDGLPLAIELAASRLAYSTPHDLLDQLTERLPTLADGPRDAPARQRTLRDTIAWSYDLLDPATQATFRCLAVFEGGFSRDAASEVSGDGQANAGRSIERLLECSLLTRAHSSTGEPRFTMLDTIHEFAHSMLADAGELEAIRRRHAAWCVALATSARDDLLNGQHAVRWYRTLDQEQPNMRAAIEYLLGAGDGDRLLQLVGATAGYWSDRPCHADLCGWIGGAVASGNWEPAEATSQALILWAWAAANLGLHAEGVTITKLLYQIAPTVGTPFALGQAHFTQGVVTEYGGDIAGAMISYEAALPLFMQAGYHQPILGCMQELGGKQLLTGDVERATATFNEAIRLARTANAERELAEGLVYGGFAALAMHDAGRAAQLLREGLELARRYTLERILLGAMSGLTGVALTLDRPEQAARLMGAVEAAREDKGIGRISEAAVEDDIRDALEDRLGAETFAVLLLEGSQLRFQEAIDAALSIAAMAQTFECQA